MKSLFMPLVTMIIFAALAMPASAQLRFRAVLTGAQEVPGVNSEAVGTVVARFDPGFTKVHVLLRVRNGVGVTGSHFHCNRPGANGPIVFGLFAPGPLFFDGTTAEGDLTNADFNLADCVPLIGRPVSNIAALAFAMQDGLIYVNVHTNAFPGGEIRGQLLEGDDSLEVDDRPGRGLGRDNGGGNGNNDHEEDGD